MKNSKHLLATNLVEDYYDSEKEKNGNILHKAIIDSVFKEKEEAIKSYKFQRQFMILFMFPLFAFVLMALSLFDVQLTIPYLIVCLSVTLTFSVLITEAQEITSNKKPKRKWFQSSCAEEKFITELSILQLYPKYVLFTVTFTLYILLAVMSSVLQGLIFPIQLSPWLQSADLLFLAASAVIALSIYTSKEMIIKHSLDLNADLKKEELKKLK